MLPLFTSMVPRTISALKFGEARASVPPERVYTVRLNSGNDTLEISLLMMETEPEAVTAIAVLDASNSEATNVSSVNSPSIKKGVRISRSASVKYPLMERALDTAVILAV